MCFFGSQRSPVKKMKNILSSFCSCFFVFRPTPLLHGRFRSSDKKGGPRWWTTWLVSVCPAFLCRVFLRCVGRLVFFFYMFEFFANFPLRDFQDRIPPGQKISHASLFAVTSPHLTSSLLSVPPFSFPWFVQDQIFPNGWGACVVRSTQRLKKWMKRNKVCF